MAQFSPSALRQLQYQGLLNPGEAADPTKISQRVQARNTGYLGAFGAGGNVAFQAGKADAYGNSLMRPGGNDNMLINVGGARSISSLSSVDRQALAAGANPNTISQATRNYARTSSFQGARQQFGVFDAVSLGSNLAKFGSGTIGTFVGNAAGQLAPSVFGTGAPALGTIGPQQAGSFVAAGGSVAGALSGAGIGYAIGSFNPLAQKQKGSQVGGTVGGAVGGAFFGPIGSVVGSFIGSTIGGFFGPGRAHPAASFATLVGEQGQLTTLGYKAKHIGTDYAEAAASETGAFSTGLGELGYQFQGVAFHGGVNDGRGEAIIGRYDTGQEVRETVGFDANNARSASNAFAQVVLKGVDLNKASPELRAAIEGLDTTGKTAGEILSELKGKVGPGAAGAAAKDKILPDPGARDRVTNLVATKQEQFDTLIKKVKEGTAGIKSTIKTSTRGDLSEVPGRRRRLVSLLNEDDGGDTLTPLLKAA